jgi:glycosyltransferase involved in cell wall biosynthesis
VMEGIRVIRVWTYITANEGFVKRVMDYVSFMLTGTVAALFVSKVDVVVGTSPQLFTACAAWMVGGFKRAPWVFELRDIWPESIKAVGAMQDSLTIQLLERIELFLYRHTSRIVAVTHAFKDTLMLRGIDGSKIDVITNGVDLSNFSPLPKDACLGAELGLNGCFVAGYIGTHGLAHGLETLLDAAQILEQMPGTENIRILFLGDGAKKAELVDSAKSRGLRNVVFVESVSKDRVPRYWSLLDVSIIHLRKKDLFISVIPSKLFECMGMGIPVLHGVAGESAAIVQTEQVGEVFESDNPHQLVDTLLKLRADVARLKSYQANGLAAARRYDRKPLAGNMLKILQGVIAK